MKNQDSGVGDAGRGLDRREFLVTSVYAAGIFAAAVSPVSAQTKITTDSKGLVAGEVSIPVADGVLPAYRAMPDKKGGKFPVVIVIHEIFGVHEWIQDICRRLAKEGYVAIAPALHARLGDPSKITDFRELQSKIFQKMPDATVMTDLDSVLAWSGKNGGDAKRAAVTGYCWGGRIVWLYAAHNPKIRAGAAWYGRLVPNANAAQNPVQPKQQIDFAEGLKVPVLGLYGGKDTGIPNSSVEQMQAALKKGGSGSDIVLYPEAGHGFLADYRPGYNREAAVDAWARMLAWFRKNKVG
jgi:carboxymethylenebutenolidase